MVTIKEYKAPDTLEEAYELLVSKNSNEILGGCGFIKMKSKTIRMGIDLINLKLDYIIEDNENIRIGATTTLRQVEINPILRKYCNGILSDCVKSIVGVQFRNSAQMGASVFSKYGFSDILPVLLVLDAKVKLYDSGIMEINEFLNSDYKKDILTEIILPKKSGRGSFENIRRSSGDFSILNGAIYIGENKECKIAIGARPGKAKLAKLASKAFEEGKEIEEVAKIGKEELSFGTNIKGSEEYRRDLCETFITNMIERVY